MSSLKGKTHELVWGLAELGAEMEMKINSFEVSDNAIDLVNVASCYVQEQAEEIERLRKVLNFYADENNYHTKTVECWEGTLLIDESIVQEDCGDKAREALNHENQ